MKRVGLIIPSVNTAVEDEMLGYLDERIHAHVTRLRMTGPYRRPLPEVLPDIRDAASALVDAGCDLVVFHCTANSTDNGEEGEEAILSALKAAGAPSASSTATALKRSLTALGVRRLALVTPYTQAMTDHETLYLREIGQEITLAKGCDVGRLHYAEMRPEFWLDRLVEAKPTNPDVYFLSCANINAISVIEPAEALLERPVITSNQVVLWDITTQLLGECAGCGSGDLFSSGRTRQA